MSGHRQYKITDYRFGQMIVGLREKIGLTQKEVAGALDVSRRTIQHWEAGTAFPDTTHLKSLIAYYLERSGFTEGFERDEALALWSQADESAVRRKSMFDNHWFDELLRQVGIPAKLTPAPLYLKDQPEVSSPKIDWGDAPDVLQIYGREKELAELSQWIFTDQCRLITVLGMGGIGKTTLVVKFAQDNASQFDYIIWRSLRNAPYLPDLLLECFQILSPVRSSKPSIQLLVEIFQQNRCLLILDNIETLHRAGDLSGIYREGFEEYQRLFQSVAQTRHQSCLVLTSRERPADLQVIENHHRVMKLAGLTSNASQAMLTDKGLFGPADSWDVFVHYYTGNPLALKIASATVRDLFSGDLAAFLKEAPVTLHTLNQLLSSQFEDLSILERDILFWLAIERDPTGLNSLRQNFLIDISNNEILSGLLSLLQRSLIERSDQGAVFSLLPVLLEFVTDRLVNILVEQITNRNLEAITKYAIIKSQSIDHIRDSQVRMILHPVISLLKRHFGSQSALADHLRQFIVDVKKIPRDAQGYAGGNLLNLMAYLNKGNIRGEDFSNLMLRQVYLQGVAAQDSNFSGVEFDDSRFTEPLETISAMTLSPSGTFLAASTFNGHIRCWNVVDGKPVWTVTNASRAWSLAFSPDETMVACSHFRGQVSLWDVATGRHIDTFEGHQAWVHTVEFDPSGQFLASGGVDSNICLWDINGKKLSGIFKGHTARVWSITFSPDGKLLVSSGDDENIYVWDARSRKLLHTIKHCTKGHTNVAFHPNGKWIVSCCEEDPYIKLWNVKTGELVADLNSRSKSPTSIKFNSEGSLLASGGLDGSVELWEMNSSGRPQYVKMLIGHQHYINVIAFSQHDLLATLSMGEGIKLWNVESGKLLRVIEGYSRLIGANAFSRDGRLLLQGDASGRIRVWDMLSHLYVSNLQGHTGPIWAIDFSPDGRTFATAGDDRVVRVWDVASLNCLKTYSELTGQIWTLSYSPDGSILAGGGSPHGVKLLDVSMETGIMELASLETIDDIWSLAFSLDGDYLVSGHTGGTVIVWDTRSGQKKIILQHGTLPVGAIRFSADGKTLITSSNQDLLKFWDFETGKCIRTVPASVDGNRTRAVAIGSNGKVVATGSGSQNIYLWQTEAMENSTTSVTIEGHNNRVWAIAISPDENYIASSDEEGTTLLSDIHSGKVIEKIFIDRPYERMNVRGITGLNAAERAALIALGAVENDPKAPGPGY